MSQEVDNSDITGELTNASAARGLSPTLVVRRPDDGSRLEIPVMTLRSHSRGGRSSACAPEPSRQAGSYSTENLGVPPTRPQKFAPEPEIHSSHINSPVVPIPGDTSSHSSLPENNSADNFPYQLQVLSGSQPSSVVPTEPSQNEQVSAGTHQTRQAFTGPQQVFILTKMLATINTSRVSIRVTSFLSGWGGVVPLPRFKFSSHLV